MNAVGKIGTFISKGVYTVSSPFHPFGGAVDIVVVQQEDGSFKSSPWYVRFGKFQGVLKSKENVVTISVNGVEAGFNMFLDHTGQTFFLRELEDGEDQIFLSLTTSEDETEELAKEPRFGKRHSFDVGAAQREQETRVDKGNGDMLTGKSSRQSTIFGFVFGRKSTRGSDTGGNLGRVSSLERAEVAADLLEKKWSTNVKSSHQIADLPEMETSISNEMKVSDADEERLGKPLPNEGSQGDENPISNERTDDNYETGSSSRKFQEQEKNDDPSYLNVSIETKEISTTTNSDETNSKTVVRTRNYDVDPQIYIFDIDETGLGNTQAKNNLNKNNFDEIACNEVAVQISTVETGDSLHRNELNTELVTVQSNKTGACNPDSITFDDTSQPNSSALVGTTRGMPTCVSGEEEISSFGDSGITTHSTGTSNTSDEKNSERLLPGEIEHCKNEFISNLSYTIQEVTSVSESAVPLGKNISNGSCAQNIESRSEESFVSEESQYGFLRNGAFVNSGNKGINTETNAGSISEQFSCVFPHLSNQELLSSDHEFTSAGAITKDFSDVRNRDAFQTSCFPASLSSDTLNSSADAGSYGVSDIPNSFNSNNEAQIIKIVKADANLKRSYSPVKANVVQDICIISMQMQTEAGKCSASCSKNLDDVQFPFSDIDSDNFGSKEIENRLSNDGKTADLPKDSALRDTGELDLGFKKNELNPRETSDDLSNNYFPINTSDPKTSCEETELFARSLPIIRSHINNLEEYGLHHSMSCSLNSVADIRGLGVLNENFSSAWLVESQTEVIETGTSTVANTDAVSDNEEQKDTTTDASVDGTDTNKDASRSHIPSGGSWNLWPFLKRSKTVSNTLTTSETTKEMDADPTSISTRSMTFDSSMKKHNNLKVQSLTPTTEELSALNLKEGQNLVKFSFSTPMLGSQQVDARIYLWKWNTRIVISDVDGTITRSDVLGQFMPLVGIDWSQTGVTHLFSAIKDNGYQLLFLSARSISQAHITRQFLSNLKQDGKALPDGPVLISPDGLFPSLYREVIRRAPHEFKISCLEDIKALFPPDYNPFYAGFGNRATDEISYLKVGIPMGKIFIIDPKGQVVVNRQIDTRSYASLHDLVNEIFPSMSSFEQEDYNSWNYWKLPLREVDF